MAWAAGHDKPVLIGEYGAEDGEPGQRTAWLNASATFVKTHPQIKGLVYFDARHQDNGRDRDFTLVPGTTPWKAFVGMAEAAVLRHRAAGGGAHRIRLRRRRVSGPLADHRLVFVAGTHRSGTTPLARVLGAHPQVSGFQRHRRDRGRGPAPAGRSTRPARTYGGAGRFALDPRSHLTEDSPLATPATPRAWPSSGRRTGTCPARCWWRSRRRTW